MAQNTNPIFAMTPYLIGITVTGSYTDRTGVAAGLLTVYTAGSSGSKVTQLIAKGQSTTNSGSVLFFITDTASANPKLFDEILITVTTSSNTSPTFRVANSYADLQLAPGQLIKTGITTGNTCSVFAQGGDF